mgnify:CR=1 FL=1
MNRGPRRLPVALCLALTVATVLARPAFAHARLLRSNPGDGAVLSAAPRELYLWFDEPIAVTLSTARLLAADGESAGFVTLRAHPADPHLVIAALPDAAPGIYSLAWTVFSEVDSHITQGTLVYGINQAVGASDRSDSAAPQVAWPEAVLGGLLFGLEAALIGAWCAGSWLLQPGRFLAAETLVRAGQERAWQFGQGAAVAAWLAGLAWLGWQWRVLGGVSLDQVLGARFGVLWLARQSLLLILVLAFVAARRGLGWGAVSAGVALLALAAVQALDGHAAGLVEGSEWAMAGQALHWLAGGAWMGTLGVAWWITRPWLGGTELTRTAARAVWRRFGLLAVLGVAVLGATGLYAAGRQVASLDAWLATLYGQVLAGKMALSVGLGLAGLANALILHPGLAVGVAGWLPDRASQWVADRRRSRALSLGLELTLGLMVLSLAGLLTATPPARGPEFAAPDEAGPLPPSLTQAADDLIVNWSIRPNEPGLNRLALGVFNTRRPAPADILRVQVRLTYLGQALSPVILIAEPLGEGRYQVDTSAVSLAGPWQAEVVVRRAAMEDSRAVFGWSVEPLTVTAPPRPVVISNAPLAGLLNWLALGVLAAGLLAAWSAARRGGPAE